MLNLPHRLAQPQDVTDALVILLIALLSLSQKVDTPPKTTSSGSAGGLMDSRPTPTARVLVSTSSRSIDRRIDAITGARKQP